MPTGGVKLWLDGESSGLGEGKAKTTLATSVGSYSRRRVLRDSTVSRRSMTADEVSV